MFPCLVSSLISLVGIGSSTDIVLNLLGALGLECLGLGTASFSLFSNLPLLDGLSLLLVDRLHKDTLVLENVTLAFHVKGVVEVFVDLLCVTVLLEKAAKDTQTSHPDDLLRHASILATDTLTDTSVATFALGSQVLALAVTRVHLGWLFDHQTILRKFANVEAGVCQADLVDFVRVKPDLAFSAFEDRCGQPLLELKGNHFCIRQRSEIATTISVRNVYCELIMGEAHSSIESARCGYSVHGMMLSRSSNPRPNLDA